MATKEITYTNIHNLPNAIVEALMFDDYDYDNSGDISASSLIKAPRQRLLEQRHKAEITIDVTDNAWKMLGSATHVVVERTGDINVLKEERLSMDILGWKVTGKIDHYENGIINDYKVTSCYSFLLGDKPDWIAAQNIYAELVRHHGFPVKHLQITAILRDWMKSKAFGDDYPKAAILVQPLELWPETKAQEYILERVRLHQSAVTLSDDALPLCTPAERWERPEKWAVKKTGNKKAYRVCDTKEQAEALHSSLAAGYEIEHRPGQSVKCDSYCLAAPFCSFYKEAK